MFGEIKLEAFQVEVILRDYLMRGEIRSRGDLFAYMNDRQWNFIPIIGAQLHPLSQDRKIGAMKRADTLVNKSHIELLSVTSVEESEKVHLSIYHRPVLFVLGHFVVQGDLHVSEDAPDQDILDELHDFFPVTRGSIFPIRAVATTPAERVPLLFVSRPAVQLYRIQETG